MHTLFMYYIANLKEGLTTKDVTYKVEGLEISEDRLGLEPSTFCILGRCSYHGATGTP